MNHGLIKADVESVDEYCNTLRKGAANAEWELIQKRTDKSLEYSQEVMKKRKESLNNAKQKGGRNWILPSEYDAFIEGIEEAIRIEENRTKANLEPGPFSQLLKYKPGYHDSGIFPPNNIWHIDMYRVLYGLIGNKGAEMRKAELSVYDGVPFSNGLCGRKKIQIAKTKIGLSNQDQNLVVANYWRDKIKDESKQIMKGKWLPLRFIFNEKELLFYKDQLKPKVKEEDE